MSDKELLGKAYEAKFAGDRSLTKKLLEKCLEQYPESAEAMRELGLIAYGLKDHKEAKKLILKSLELDDSFWGHLYFAMVLHKLDELASAEAEFKRAALSAPNHDGRQIVSRYYADFLVTRNRYEEAKEQAILALPFFVDDPKDHDRLNHLIKHCEFKLANH